MTDSPTNDAFEGLYVHIPFCVRKCGYCDFYSEAGSEEEMQRFLNAMYRELEMRSKEFGKVAPRTVFFGGGTPTKLSADQLEQLGNMLHRNCDLSAVREWSCEINPGTLDAEKAAALRAMGVNRASIGVQSFDPKNLEFLDREHEAGKAEEAVQLVREAGITNVSVDLIYALPGQSISDWQVDLERALELQTQHISLYTLVFEEGTPLTAKMKAGEIEPTDPEVEAELYAYTCQRVREAGYEHYEISNFAKPGHRCLHNMLYWRCANWLGIGPSAHSALNRLRWGNLSDHRPYARMLLDEGKLPVAFSEESSAEEYADEILMMGLRTVEGVEADDFHRRCGFTIEERCGPMLAELIGSGHLQWDDTHLIATEKGRLVLDEVILSLTRSPMQLTQT